MRIYIKRYNPVVPNQTNAAKMHALEMMVSRALSNRRDISDMARTNVYVEMGNLDRMQRQRYLRETYETVLRDVVGAENEVLKEIKKQALRLGFTVTTEAHKLNICFPDETLTDVMDIFHGDRAFQTQAPSGKRKRTVYIHRETGEHYIKDDLDIMTARYAYRSMNASQYNELRTTGRIAGRKKLFDEVSERVRNSHGLGGGAPSLEQAIYIHQRYGSGEEQRGVCLSSTHHGIVSDQGFVFGGAAPVRLAIDLARIDSTRILINLYQNAERWVGLPYYRWQKNKPRALTYTEQDTKEALIGSIIKNTELFLCTLLKSDVLMIHAWKVDTRTWKELMFTHQNGAPDPIEPQEPPPHVKGAKGNEE